MGFQHGSSNLPSAPGLSIHPNAGGGADRQPALSRFRRRDPMIVSGRETHRVPSPDPPPAALEADGSVAVKSKVRVPPDLGSRLAEMAGVDAPQDIRQHPSQMKIATKTLELPAGMEWKPPAAGKMTDDEVEAVMRQFSGQRGVLSATQHLLPRSGG
jgi:hypothetical protein